MRIIKLQSENVKRLHAVEITPDGNMIIIGGKNGQGKSSVLDSIQYTLEGGKGCAIPVHIGEDKATTTLELGEDLATELTATRTITKEGVMSLVVKNKEGVKQSSPQSILDKLKSKLTFDPLEFSRQKSDVQGQTLCKLVGLDFTKTNADRKTIFDKRTDENRKLKEMLTMLSGMPVQPDGTPDADQSVVAIVGQQANAIACNKVNEEKRQAVKEVIRSTVQKVIEANEIGKRIAETRTEIERLEALIETAKTELSERNTVIEAEHKANQAASEELEFLTDTDLAPFTAQLANIEKTNASVRAKKSHADMAAKLTEQEKLTQDLTGQITKLDADQKAQIASAQYPIPGMSIDPAGGVLINGIPLEQASSAEQLKVSVAIGLALNPTLKVLLIRDGSLLDEDSLKTVAQMAEAAGAQVWMERVGTDASTSVVIHDGYVSF